MFESLVRNLADQELVHVLKSIDEELDGVELRLHDKMKSPDSVTVLVNSQISTQLEVWRPFIKGLITRLEIVPSGSASRATTKLETQESTPTLGG